MTFHPLNSRLTVLKTMALEWPDYEKEAKKEKERQRRRKREGIPISEDSDDDVEYTAKKRKIRMFFSVSHGKMDL